MGSDALCVGGDELGSCPVTIGPSDSGEGLVDGVSVLDLTEEYFVNAEVGDVRSSCGAGEAEGTGAS